MPPEFWVAAVVLATDIYNCTPHRSLDMESPHYHRYHKQPDLSFFRAFGCTTVVHRGRDLVVQHQKLSLDWGEYLGAPATVVAPSLSTVPVLLGYMPLLTPDLMRHSLLFAQPIRECIVRITPPLFSWSSSLQLHAESDSGQHRRATPKHCRSM